MIILRREEIRESTIMFAALLAVATLVVLASVDTHSFGDDAPLTLPKFGLVAIPDSLALLSALAALNLSHFSTLVKNSKPMSRFLVCSSALVLWGVTRGLSVNLEHVLGVGAEVRGLCFTCTVMALSFAATIYRPRRVAVLLTTLGVTAIVRDTLEQVMFGALVDVSQGILSAATAVTLHAYILQRQARAWWLLPIAAALDLFIVTSRRRTPIVILIVGLMGTLLFVVLSRRTRATARATAVCLFLAICGGAVALDKTLLHGQLQDRLASISLRESHMKGTSNWEHLHDAEDALDLIERSPILGYGTGTLFSNRVLSYAGDDVPFHSPYLHSWVRFGIVGLIAYVYLQFTVSRRLFQSAFGRKPKALADPTSRAVGLGLFAYLFGQWALPPFYLDYKQSLVVGVFLGILFGFESLRQVRLATGATSAFNFRTVNTSVVELPRPTTAMEEFVQ